MTSSPSPSEQSIEQGLINRRRVLGDAWVDKSVANANAVNVEFQRLITSYAWDQIWSRPGLDRRTRRIMVLAITASMGRWDEFELHVRTGLQAPQGDEQAAPLDLETLKEVLLQTAVYAGVPAGNTGMAIVLKVARELGLELAPADFYQPRP